LSRMRSGMEETCGAFHKGREEIMGFFAKAGQNITGVHFFVQPKIKILSETEAEGSWYLLQQGTKGDMAFWLSAVEYEKYVKVNGEWRFKEIKFREFFAARYEEGWHKNKMWPLGLWFRGITKNQIDLMRTI